MTNIPLTKARLAKEIGITRQSINTWVNRGDLVFDKTGKMSVDEFNRQLGDKLHPVSKIRTDKYTPISNNADDGKNKEEAELDYHAARTIREIAEARTAELKLNILSGEYVEKSQVEKIVFERARQFRDGVMSCKRRISPELAGIESSKDIENILDREFRFLLENFAKLPVVE